MLLGDDDDFDKLDDIYSLLMLEGKILEYYIYKIKSANHLQASAGGLFRSPQQSASFGNEQNLQVLFDHEEYKLKEEILYALLTFTTRIKLIVQVMKKQFDDQSKEQYKSQQGNSFQLIGPNLTYDQINKQFFFNSLKYAFLGLKVYLSCKQHEDKGLENFIDSVLDELKDKNSKSMKDEKRFQVDVKKIILHHMNAFDSPEMNEHQLHGSYDAFSSALMGSKNRVEVDQRLFKVRNLMLDSKYL